MYNSLPSNIKNKVRTEYHLRLLITVVVFIIFLQISFWALMFPSWLISLEKEQNILLQSEKSNKVSLDLEIENMNPRIQEINTVLKMINSNLKYPLFGPLLDNILSKKTGDILIKEVRYASSGENTGSILLSGTGATRESLVLFVKKLEESSFFEKVDLPISNFTKDKNINFSINMMISP
jgi:hypothetical protein